MERRGWSRQKRVYPSLGLTQHRGDPGKAAVVTIWGGEHGDNREGRQ